jgi:hypothetical protein
MQVDTSKNHQKQPSFDHLGVLMGPLGIYQHALYREPRLSEGYCTDDNARAVTVLRISRQKTDWEERCWQFVLEARMDDGHYRNFRDVSGQWLDEGGSEDTQARVARMLATVATDARRPNHAAKARKLLLGLLPHLTAAENPRGWAETAIALAAFCETYPDETEARDALEYCASCLLNVWKQTAASSWPWFEKEMTYANALLPHGLAAAQRYLHDENLTGAFQTSAAFLLATTMHEGVFKPIGNDGWYAKGQPRALFDQQPIEAVAMLDFLLDCGEMLPQEPGLAAMAAPYLWFFGRNAAGVPTVDSSTGACADGLEPAGVNLNCGAESLLSYLLAEALMNEASVPLREYAAAERTALLLQTARA